MQHEIHMMFMSRAELASKGVIPSLRGEQEVIHLKPLANLKSLNSDIN